MKINIAQPGPPQMMEMSLYSRPSTELQAYIQQRNNETAYRMQNLYGEEGKSFLQQAQQHYQTYADDTGVKAAQAIILTSSAAISDISENLVPLETFEQLQSAHLRYQNFLMANPLVRRYYLDGRAEGYSDTYNNFEGNAVGLDQTYYREVINGVGKSSYDETFDLEKGEEWVTTTHDSLEGLEPLEFLEKVNIINAWNLQNLALSKDIDPTSIDGFNLRPEL